MRRDTKERFMVAGPSVSLSWENDYVISVRTYCTIGYRTTEITMDVVPELIKTLQALYDLNTKPVES